MILFDPDRDSISRIMPSHRHRWRPRWGAILSGWIVVFVAVWQFTKPRDGSPSASNELSAGPVPVAVRGDLSEDEKATIEIFHRASPSVVYITSIEVARDFRTLNLFSIPRGSGSGFIYDKDGHVVTNLHVVYGSSRLMVTLGDESEWKASVVGYEPDKDLAVLKIEAPPEKLHPLPIGTAHDLQVGQKVYAIGNPFGFDHSLTTGIVSALGREIRSLSDRPIRDVIQTDAAINPGNSGGPLLDSAGRLIGVNTQIASPSGASAGIGFAVPVDIVRRVVPQIIKYGKAVRPRMGVTTLEDRRIAKQLDIKEGVLILEVAKDSAAAQAGLRGTLLTSDRSELEQLGDIIIKIDGKPIRTQFDLIDALEKRQIGDEISVTVSRDKSELDFRVRLQAQNLTEQ